MCRYTMYLSPGGRTAGEAGLGRGAMALIDEPVLEPMDCMTLLAARWLEAISRYRW